MYLGDMQTRVYPAGYSTWSEDKPAFRTPTGYEWKKTGKEGVTTLETGGEIVNFEWVVVKVGSPDPARKKFPVVPAAAAAAAAWWLFF